MPDSSSNVVQIGHPPRRRPRLAIVSTYDELCGIAGYTRALIRQLERYFEIEVFDLDQFFMRSRDRKVRRIADQMIKDFCARAREFDFINIQLEYGTLGYSAFDISRRFEWLAKAAPALSVTFHTITRQGPIDVLHVMERLSKLKFREARDYLRAARETNQVRCLAALRRHQKVKPVNVIVPTRRDYRIMRHVNGLDAVHDHPLTFLSEDDVARIRQETRRSDFVSLADLPDEARLIGVFGFLSEYKGFETVVRAMHALPDSYHLVFFGGLHPNEIRERVPLHPYLKTLLGAAHVDSTVFDRFGNTPMSIAVDSAMSDLLLKHPKNIAARLHFMGAQTDENFARGMAICDQVVLPYLEVGQASSGPMSIALEMGVRIIAARNHAFIQFARYHPDSIEFFEIGNHVELAERMRSRRAFPARSPRAYNVNTNAALYVKANTPKDFSRSVENEEMPRPAAIA